MKKIAGYMVWNYNTEHIGIWNSKKQDWVIPSLHCGDTFIVANGSGFDTSRPEKWTPCRLERLNGDWGEGEGFILVNEDEDITEPRWTGFRDVKLH